MLPQKEVMRQMQNNADSALSACAVHSRWSSRTLVDLKSMQLNAVSKQCRHY